MQIEEKRIIIDSSWFSVEREVRRSKGIHLSHVLNFIEDQNAATRRDRDGNKDSLHNYAVSGFLWERIIEKVVNLSQAELFEWLFTRALFDVDNPKLIRPGEVNVDICECPGCAGTGCTKCGNTGRIKLYFTPDMYSIDEELLEEHKWTTRSSNNEITSDKFARWIQYQIPVYLKVLRLLKCRLRVCFSRGDYKSGEPEWREYLITYSQQELDEIFDMVLMNAKYMVDNGLADYEAT